MAIRVTLLDRADALLAEAAGARDPADRFLAAYLAALRGAGAALAGRTPRSRSRSAWVLLSRVEPDLSGWAEFFASHSDTRAAIEAGISRTITAAEADRFHGEVSRFLTVVEERLEVVGCRGLRGEGGLVRASA
ncbi:SAV_6107 family HEPN domain-containing protein [Rhodococcus sp. NPDC004095]